MSERVYLSPKTRMPAPTSALKAGDDAPPFTTLDDGGRRVSLSQFRGKWVVLFFYPKDDTPG